MGRIPWNMPAILVPPGNRDNIKGTLSFCLRYWRDEMTPPDQNAAMIAMAGGRWIEPNELLHLLPHMPGEAPLKN